MSLGLANPPALTACEDPGPGTPRRRWAFWRSPPGQPAWARPTLLGIALVAALLYARNITPVLPARRPGGAGAGRGHGRQRVAEDRLLGGEHLRQGPREGLWRHVRHSRKRRQLRCGPCRWGPRRPGDAVRMRPGVLKAPAGQGSCQGICASAALCCVTEWRT
ncbi:MAG TPA: hypothetical protein DHU96_34905 [Actinobacteria bacterium]|nr:hypothetical protein [Actinomycetota bacterium]